MNLLRTAVFAVAASLAATAAHGQVAFRSAATAVQATAAFGTITYIGGATAQGQGNNVNLTLPAAAQSGDVVITLVAVEDETNASVTKPAAMTLIRGDNAGNHVQVTSYRVITGADVPGTTNYDWSWTGTEDYAASILVFRGVDTSLPINASNGTATNATNTTTVNIPAVTPTVANTLLVAAVSIRSGSTFGTWSGGATERTDSRSNAGGDEVGAATATDPGPGAGVSSGAYTVTASDNDTSRVGVLLALRPALAGLTINVPAGTASGDVMLASIAVRPSSVLLAPPTGWSAQAATVQNVGNTSRQQIFYRIAGGAEPASYTWFFDTAHTGAAGAIASYSGVDTAAPINAFGGNTTPQGGDTTLQHRALAVTTTVADAMVVSTHSVGSAVTWTSPGVNERVDVPSQASPNAAGISLAFYDATQAVAGTTGDRIATANANGDNGSAHFIALRPFVPQPVLHWSLDQLAWNSTPGEVADLSGNGLHGTAFLGANTTFVTPAIAGSPGTCRYGAFDGVDDYVEVADNPLLDITNELTVMMWVRPTAYAGAGLKTFVSKDGNYEAHLTTTGTINWWWGGGALELNSAGTVPLNQWTHVALVYSRTGAFQRIYLNGVQDANTNNQAGALVANAMPFQIASDQGFAGRQFPGLIDEVYVFANALSQSRIQQYMNTTRACASAINHFAISHSGSGVGCVDQLITITAHDATHTAVDANALAVNITTSHGKGTWTGIQAGGGTLNDLTAGDGAANYTFAGGSNSVTLLFRNTNLAGTSETFNFNVSGGGFSETTGVANLSDDPPFTMYEAGFRFRNIEDANETVPVQISGKSSNTGYNARTLRLQAINTNTSSGSCSNLFASQAQNVLLGAECGNPAACAGAALSVNGVNLQTNNDNAGPGTTLYTSVALNFDANSEADTVIRYPDAGQMTVHAQYDLNPLVAGNEMVGASNAFVVRPFGLAFPGVAHSNTAAGAVLAAAGDGFSMTVQGYQWSAGEDANNDGVPDAGSNITDNGAVPNFAATATVSPSANLPGVALGQVRRGAGCVAAGSVAMSGGAGAAADWCYSEVGNVVLNADVADYLAAGVNIAGNSGLDGDANGGYVGRFRPKQFRLVGAPTFTPRYIATCPGTTFAYMGEGIRLDGFTMEAINTAGNRTVNYDGAYARHDPVAGTAKTAFSVGARSGTTDHTTRVAATHLAVPAWSQGQLTAGGNPLQIAMSLDRLPANTPDGPFPAAGFGIAPTDADGVQLPAYNQDVNNDATADHVLVGTTDIRFGRLWMQNAFGSGATVLPVPIRLQYWSGGNFVLNADDSCTTLARAEVALDFTPVSGLTACETAVNAATIPFSGGEGALTLSAPGAANQGSVLLTANLNGASGSFCNPASYVAASNASKPYLLGRWDNGPAYDDPPAARAAFGLYGSQPKNFIFFRENY